MARRQRRNGGQWKVLLVAREHEGEYLGEGWSADRHPDLSASRGVGSLDEAIQCAFAHFEGTGFDFAYVFDPSGFPHSIAIGLPDEMHVFTLSPVSWNAEYSSENVLYLRFSAIARSYTRSRGVWQSDEPKPYKPGWGLILVGYAGPRSAYGAWPYSHASVLRDVVSERERLGDVRPIDVEEARSLLLQLTEGVFARPILEDQ